MIITKTPLRITLGGGGSDLSPNGRCIAGAIDKYVYVAINDHYDDPPIFLKYAQTERVKDVADIQNTIIRRCMKATHTTGRIEITSMADLPARSGLGGSGAFTVGLLHALHAHNGDRIDLRELATEACQIDTGLQDQWIAAYGGVKLMDFIATNRWGGVDTRLANMDSFLRQHPHNFALYDTNLRRDAAEVLAHATFDRLVLMRQVNDVTNAINHHNLEDLGRCFTAQWQTKLSLNPTPAHVRINEMIQLGLDQGALGGKLVGAGDGGCILFVIDKPIDLPFHIPFTFDTEGTRRIV